MDRCHPSDPRAHEHLDLLRDGLKDAIAAVALVEELKQLDSAPPVAGPVDVDAAAMLGSVLRSLQAQSALDGLVLPPPRPAAVTLRFRRDDLRLLMAHCLLSVAEWAPPRSCLRIEWAAPTPSTAALSIQVSAPGSATGTATGTATGAEAGHGLATATAVAPSPLARTQEGLRFSIAQRLASRNNAILRSHGGGDGQMAIVLHAPGGMPL